MPNITIKAVKLSKGFFFLNTTHLFTFNLCVLKEDSYEYPFFQSSLKCDHLSADQPPPPAIFKAGINTAGSPIAEMTNGAGC